jgi:hypothetical protein
MAQANFNIRGWQGRWRYTASTALFFLALFGAIPSVSGAPERLCRPARNIGLIGAILDHAHQKVGFAA